MMIIQSDRHYVSLTINDNKYRFAIDLSGKEIETLASDKESNPDFILAKLIVSQIKKRYPRAPIAVADILNSKAQVFPIYLNEASKITFNNVKVFSTPKDFLLTIEDWNKGFYLEIPKGESKKFSDDECDLSKETSKDIQTFKTLSELKSKEICARSKEKEDTANTLLSTEKILERIEKDSKTSTIEFIVNLIFSVAAISISIIALTI